jgi:hypothetical protein
MTHVDTPVGLISYRDLIEKHISIPPSIMGAQLLVPNGRTLVYGDTGVYKSFLCHTWLYHISNGMDFLGYPMHMTLNTAYIELEVTEVTMQLRLQGMYDKYGLPADKAYILVEESFEMNAQTARNLVKIIREYDLGVVCLDPLYLVAQGSLNKGEDLASFFRLVNHVRGESGVCIILAHHANKGMYHEGAQVSRGLKDASGGWEIGAWPDTAIHLVRQDKYTVRMIWEKVRDGDPPKEQWLRFNPEHLILEPAPNDPATAAAEILASGPLLMKDFDKELKEVTGLGVNAVRGKRLELVVEGVLREYPNPVNKKQKMMILASVDSPT